MRVGHLDENKAMLYEAACVRPPLAGTRVARGGGFAGTDATYQRARQRREETARGGGRPGRTTRRKKEEKEEKPKPAATGGFSAAFLAKANAGYSKAQEALEEELKSKGGASGGGFDGGGFDGGGGRVRPVARLRPRDGWI